MEELESQVAKIQIGNVKSVSSYVFILAERAPFGSSELYVIAELPLFNPAAETACQKIVLSIAAALKRAYKKGVSENQFETAVAQVNEELGKLAEMGQTHWIDKLSCILASKDNQTFSIATCGKVAAYLYRNEEFTDISCSPQSTHPLKTFENVAFGKLKLEDVLILSTTQLFNYLSIDRLKHILSAGNFLQSAQTIIEILKENAGPEVAFGTILNMQVRVGETQNEEIDLESYTTTEDTGPSLLGKAAAFVKSAFALDKNGRVPKVSLPHVSFSGSLHKVQDSTKTFASGIKIGLSKLVQSLTSLPLREFFSIQNYRGFSKQKKIFFASVLLLLMAFVVNVVITAKVKNAKKTEDAVTEQLQEVQGLLASAESFLLYKDENSARDYMQQALNKMPVKDKLTNGQQELYSQTESKFDQLRQKVDKTTQAEVTALGSLGQGERLFAFGNLLATQVNTTIVSYNKDSGDISDSNLMSSERLVAAVQVRSGQAVVYNGSSLLVWDWANKQFSEPFSSSVPDQNSYAGLKLYATNSRVYMVNKSTNQILSFAAGDSIGRPVVASKNANDLGNAIDIAIDGSIYVLNNNGVNKYQSGNLTDFQLPTLFTPLSGQGRIATDRDFKNIYILDSGNNRILVFDKKGQLVLTLVSKEFTKLADFQVDEKNKTAYVLNDGKLLKVTLP